MATVIALLAVVAGGAALLLHAVTTPWRPVIVLTTFAHYAMWAVPVGVVLAAVARRWVLLAVAAVAAALVLAVQAPALVADTPPAHGTALTVLQTNLRIGQADPRALVRLVRAHHVELLATEELTVPEQQRLVVAGLPALLPFHFLAPLPLGGGGLGVWSRYPLSQTQNLPRLGLGVLLARVHLPSGATPTFAAVHLTPPYPYPAGTWRHEIARLRGVLHGLPGAGPVLAAGDYNATTDHGQFRDLLAHGYRDAATQAGAGYLPSYPTDRWFGPVIGIDHVLTRGAVATDASTLDLPGSDHRSLLARIVLAPRG